VKLVVEFHAPTTLDSVGGRKQLAARAEANAQARIAWEIRDSGPGVPDEIRDKIFTPFSQVDNRYDRQAGGTGLGLALVQGLAHLHGGRTWIESEEGVGTTVFVYFPLAGVKRERKHAVQ